MTKRDILTLLSPSVFFVVAAVAAFVRFTMIGQRWRDDGSPQKFEAFVANVQSGKLQLTTDRWLDGMRRQETLIEAYRQTGGEVGQMLEIVGLTTVAGIAFQMAAVYSVRKKLSKPTSSTP